MDKKYIVKNCPCKYASWETEYECYYYNKPCKDCTDCLIKKVIEKCMVCSEGWSDWAMAEQVKADEVLQLFEIEEVNYDRK